MKPFPRHPPSPKRHHSSQTFSFQIISPRAVESADKEPVVCSELEQTVPAGCSDKPPCFSVRTQRLSLGSSLCWGSSDPQKQPDWQPTPQKGWKQQQEEKPTSLGWYRPWMQILNFRAPGNAAMGFAELRPGPFPYSAPKSCTTAVKNPRGVQESKHTQDLLPNVLTARASRMGLTLGLKSNLTSPRACCPHPPDLTGLVGTAGVPPLQRTHPADAS